MANLDPLLVKCGACGHSEDLVQYGPEGVSQAPVRTGWPRACSMAPCPGSMKLMFSPRDSEAYCPSGCGFITPTVEGRCPKCDTAAAFGRMKAQEFLNDMAVNDAL